MSNRNTPGAANLRAIFRVTLLGTLVNFVLAVGKIFVGVRFGVNSVLVDGIQSVANMVADMLLLLAVKFSYKPRSRAQPYGNRKLETFVALGIALLLLVTAGVMLYRSFQPSDQTDFNLWPALIISLIAVISKEMLFRHTLAQGKALKSPAVIANAWNHRADAISTGAVVVCILLGMAFGHFTLWDRIGVVVVCILIVKAVWDIARGAIMELLDHAPSADVVAQVEHIIDHVPDVRFVHDVRVRSVAGTLYVSCTIEVDGRLSIDDGARIADQVENTLIENLEGIANVLIQVRPAGSFAARVLATGLENVTDEDLV